MSGIKDQFVNIQHTRGPWFCKPQGEADEWYITDETGHWIFGFRQNGEMLLSEQDANAKLIASAPDLLMALRNAVYGLRANGLGEHPITEQALAAIAKAEGQHTLGPRETMGVVNACQAAAIRKGASMEKREKCRSARQHSPGA